MSELKVSIGASATVNGASAGHSSPLEDLKDDIVREVGSTSTHLSKIDKIVLVDVSGYERDYTTELSYTDNTPNNVVVSGLITATEDYAVSKIRLKAGTKNYFEFSWSRSISAGDQVSVSVTITMSVSGSLSGAVSGTLLSSAGLTQNVLKALIGATREQVGFAYAVLLTGDYAILYKRGVTLSYDIENNTASGDTGSQSPSASGDAELLTFRNSADHDVISYYLSAPLSITSSMLIRVTFTFTVT